MVQEKVHLIAGMPHMHVIGSAFSQRILRAGGAMEPLIDLENWEFNLQFIYDLGDTGLLQPRRPHRDPLHLGRERPRARGTRAVTSGRRDQRRDVVGVTPSMVSGLTITPQYQFRRASN